VFGTSAFAVRLGAVGLSVLGAWGMYRLGREVFGSPYPGLMAVAALQVTPLVWAGSLIMTIDAPFVALWILALLLLHRALRDGGIASWLGAGVAIGLGLLAKYTMLFVLPGLILYLWRAPEARPILRTPGPYLTMGIALGLFSPVVVWNLRHGWLSAQHVASQGRGAGLTWVHLVDFLGSQLGVLTPVVAALLAWGAVHGARVGLVEGREPSRFLAAFALPILAFYLVVGLQGKVQANWAAAAYPPLALLAAGALLDRIAPGRERTGRWLARLAVVGVGLALIVSILGHVTDSIGLPPRLDPTTRLKGWAELGAAVSSVRAGMPAPDRTFLASDRYQITSELAFYAAGRPPAYNFNLGRRLNQYDLWEGPGLRVGWDAVYVVEGTAPIDPRVVAAFDRLDAGVRVDVRRGGRIVRTFTVYRGFGFRAAPDPGGLVRY
jgi:undecaprenyl-diphosphatase